MTSSVLIELVRHKTWATLEVVEICQRVAPELLDKPQPGTYGSIRDTLRHLFRADERYYLTVTGEDSSAPEDAGLGTLAEAFKARARKWETVLQDPSLPDKDVTTRWGTCKALAPLAQSIHHAEVHRTHVLSMLGAQGVQVADFDIWEWGTKQGYVRESETATA